MTEPMISSSEALNYIQTSSRWFYTRHALERMKQRRIFRADVEHCVSQATDCVPVVTDEGPGWRIAGPDQVGERIAAVIVLHIFLPGGSRNVVVTVVGD